MADPTAGRPPVRRKKKRPPKWQRMLRYYWPAIRILLVFAACIVLIAMTISAVTNGLGKRAEAKKQAAQLQNSNEEITVPQQDPSSPEDEDSEGYTEFSSPDMVGPIQFVKIDVDAILDKANFIAAGYDYETAIAMLKEVDDWDKNTRITDRIAEYEALDSQLVVYQEMNTITHVFFHSLIVEPERAFDGEFTEDGYNLYMTTIKEFNAILEDLYENGYVLVSPHDVAGEVTDESGTHFAYKEIRLPAGKKPIMMSQDDLNYYGYMIDDADGSGDTPVFVTEKGDGFAHKLVVGADGYPTCEYMDADGNITTGDYDLVPCLETFIQNHPDFSYHGARATLGMTGYEGVFGYRTKPAYEAALGSAAYQEEIEGAKAVAKCLREHGWDLASHSYGHPAYGNLSAWDVEIDSDKWENTVQTIIGDTDIILYPHGSDIAGLESYDFNNPKYTVLYEDGYRYFFNVDNCVAWHQMDGNYFRGNRRDLDGYRMYHYPDASNDIIDARSILDEARPLPVPEIG